MSSDLVHLGSDEGLQAVRAEAAEDEPGGDLQVFDRLVAELRRSRGDVWISRNELLARFSSRVRIVDVRQSMEVAGAALDSDLSADGERVDI